MTYQSLREITITENAVKEVLRLHPPLFMLVRVAQEDFQYKRYHIPKGTWIIVSPTVSHKIPSVFRDPLRFDPDRFAPPREEDKREYAFIPFGGGRRNGMNPVLRGHPQRGTPFEPWARHPGDASFRTRDRGSV